MSQRILVIDNFDSFVYTLNGYLLQLGAETEVIRNNQLEPHEIPAVLDQFDAVLISPGPGNPGQAGISLEVIRHAAQKAKPLFGVCLGHQAIAEAFGAEVRQAEQLMHGKISVIAHEGDDMFDGVKNPFRGTRYHSLAVVETSVPAELLVTARTQDGVIMGLRHRDLPIHGVQFHPESVMTEGGYLILGNWLNTLGVAGAKERSRNLSPVMSD